MVILEKEKLVHYFKCIFHSAVYNLQEGQNLENTLHSAEFNPNDE